MKYDLKDVTFIIPVRIDSSDRLRNLFLSVSYILKYFDTNIIIKESDKNSIVLNKLNFLLESNKNIKYIFEKDENTHFHRTHLLNDMILEANTDIVVNYDADILLPINSYIHAKLAIKNDKYDLIYPFRHGTFGERKIDFKDKHNFLEKPEELLSHNFILKNLDLANIEEYCFYSPHSNGYGYADFGMCQFFKYQSYIEGFLENENFISYAPEDKERYFRFNTLGYKIARIDDFAYHIEHSRNQNSSVSNPYMEHNNKLWNFISGMDQKQLREYYNKQKYYNQRTKFII